MYCSTVPCGAPPPPEILNFTPTPVWLTSGMQEAPGQFRELTLQRLHKLSREQFMNDLGRYYAELRKDPERLERETREDMEWQLGVFNAVGNDESEDWSN